MSADPVRRRALDLLVQVERGGNLDTLLDGALADLARRRADPRDAAFLAELVRGTLQWRARYDHLIGRFARREPPTRPQLLNLLRLSLHQLVALDQVPPFAAVHQAGELCRAAVGDRFGGFVNGLLQAARRELRPDETTQRPERQRRLRAAFSGLEGDHLAWLAAWHSHPRWLVERWSARWGAERTAALCAWNNEPVPVVFRVLAPAEPQTAAADLAAAGCPVEPLAGGRALRCRERRSREAIADLLAARPHLIVQDPAVQAATDWLLEALASEDRPLLDLCAAPGGKTACLAAARPGQAPLVALDNRPARIRMLRAAAKRIEGRPVSVVLADGTAPPLAAASFAGVLLDGPCSGSGVLRHHPDGRWQLAPERPAANRQLLGELARRAGDLTAPGGALLYATCSLEPEENEEVLDGLLAERDDLEPLPDASGVWRRTWLPGEAAGDGFFAARLRRRQR